MAIDFYPTVSNMEFTPYKSVEFQSNNNQNGAATVKTNKQNQGQAVKVINPNVREYPIVRVQAPPQGFVVPQNIQLRNDKSKNQDFVYGVIGAIATIVVIGAGLLMKNTNLRQRLSSWYKKTWEVKNSYHPNIVLDNAQDIRTYRESVVQNLSNDKRYRNDLKCIDIFTGNKKPDEIREIVSDVYEIARTISHSNYKTPKVFVLLKQDAGILNLANMDSSLDELDADVLKNGVLEKIREVKLGFVAKDPDYAVHTKANIVQSKNETNYVLNLSRSIRRFFGSFSD